MISIQDDVAKRRVEMLKVTFDSNAWERVFAPNWETDQVAQHIAVIRGALKSRAILGFICETTFRLETLKRSRLRLVSGSEFTMLECNMRPQSDKPTCFVMSLGADDRRHPGIDPRQWTKLVDAFDYGVRLIDGQAWMGLAGPAAPDWRTHAVPLTQAERAVKEVRQMDVFHTLQGSGVGMASLNARLESMERAVGVSLREGGWRILDTITDERERTRAVAEISEWADAEVISSHYGYQHDILCTEDRARKGRSSFDATSKLMLAERFGIRLADLPGLAALVQTGQGWFAEHGPHGQPTRE